MCRPKSLYSHPYALVHCFLHLCSQGMWATCGTLWFARVPAERALPTWAYVLTRMQSQCLVVIGQFLLVLVNYFESQQVILCQGNVCQLELLEHYSLNSSKFCIL